MPRINYVDSKITDDRSKELLRKLDHKNIFKMLAHSPSHFETYARMGNAIRFKGELDPTLRELSIIRVGILCNAEYEVIAHKKIARNVGVENEKIKAVHKGPYNEAFTNLERDILRFTDEVVKSDRVSDEVFSLLQNKLTPGAIIELHLAIGYYIMTSKFLVTFDIDLQNEKGV